MQDETIHATLNGISPNYEPQQAESIKDESKVNGHVLENGLAEPNGASNAFPTAVDATPTPAKRGRKRKYPGLSTPDSSQPFKKLSPPWKKFEPTNPTSFSENGRRKSGRTSSGPLDLPPTGKKRGRKPKDPAARALQMNGTPKPANAITSGRARRESRLVKTSPLRASTPPRHHWTKKNNVETRPVSEEKKNRRPAKQRWVYEPVLPTVPTEPEPLGRTRRITHVAKQPEAEAVVKTPAPAEKSSPKKLRLNLPPRSPPLLHPGNKPLRKYETLAEALEAADKLGEEQAVTLTEEDVRREAEVYKRLEAAARPGGILHGDAWLADDGALLADPHPPQARVHRDFLHEHVRMFVRELNEEQRRHRKLARQIAYDCQERWLRLQPKSFAQIVLEHRANFQRLVCKELKDKWALVRNHASQKKIALFKQQQVDAAHGHFTQLVETQALAVKQRQQHKDESTVVGMDSSDVDESVSGSEEASGDSDDSDESDESSDADSQSESGEENVDDFGDLTGEELRKRIYGETAEATPILENGTEAEDMDMDEDTDMDEGQGQSTPPPGYIDPSKVQLDEVADDMLDDEDESDDSGTEESESEDEGSEEASEEESEEDVGLFGFFGKSARASIKKTEDKIEASPQTDAIQNGDVEAHVSADHTSNSDVPSGQETPATTVASKSDAEGLLSNLADQANDQVAAREELNSSHRIDAPALLRGELRVYQRQGLDWLAGLYEANDNGILADEMGLGKTIQTIALLAHLAVEKEVWGPHLVVVPTSVMLNWEMEFKKWCPGFKILTYYGTQEERKAKRRGWMDNDRWHVCITSYQLVLQDASALKRRNWHYMVLDEAHNIKNFQSQRWQTLLTFKTRSRLLLTGTPLQNNISELWSLLFFLEPEVDENGDSKFKDLHTFGQMFNKPVDQILDQGREAMDDASRKIVTQLHQILRPHLLRRLKLDVEKQMPKKYEHIVKCRLSKRQRQLYDGYMGLAGTRDSFSSGNYMSIINCLMQLRKVCNHPDLFETRQIVTSYAMPKSAVADYEIKELLVRRKFLEGKDLDLVPHRLLNLWHPNDGTLPSRRRKELAAIDALGRVHHAYKRELEAPQGELGDVFGQNLALLARQKRLSRLGEVTSQWWTSYFNTRLSPVYGAGLVQRFTFEKAPHLAGSQPKRRIHLTNWFLNTSSTLKHLFSLDPCMSDSTRLLVRKFGFVTPSVVAPGMAQLALTPAGVQATKQVQLADNPFFEAQTRLSIAFPDKALIQYDCGKLQQLDLLLRQLQAGGHRALIFTQMTKVLDVLEQFMNLHGHRYLRLDGSTKVESRQALTDQFNQDTRILAFILSSRSGGLGINLTGADSVIFYDLDWNPAMDKQCQDRCHRIGQTRDVHIYRFVSEGTIEANILRKSNQKRMLDDIVIQEGEFTTDAFYRSEEGNDTNAEADAALDKVLGGGTGGRGVSDERALEQAEDREDREAAQQARKEDVVTDIADFEDKAPATPAAPAQPDAKFEAPAPAVGDGPATEQVEEEQEPGSYEDYMLRFMEFELQDATFLEMSERQRRRAKKGKMHGIRIRA